MHDRAHDIHEFWFGPPGAPTPFSRWFEKNPTFDAEIRSRFGDDYALACRGELDAWAASPGDDPRSALALVVVLDQFSRNLYRDSPLAFAQDERALGITMRMLDLGADLQLGYLERYVLLLPTMHSEALGVQQRGVAAYAALLAAATADAAPEGVLGALRAAHDFAVRHEAIVARFGRFPHRNAVLGRTPTPDETEFLREPGSSF